MLNNLNLLKRETFCYNAIKTQKIDLTVEQTVDIVQKI